ncbi:MAG: LppM family (lipo)protein [Armatimonadota bacterium]
MKHTTRLPLLIMAIALLIACSGCMKVSMDLAVAPDGSSSGRMLAGIDASLAQAGETKSGPLAGLAGGAANWKTRDYREGNWLMTEAVGSAPPGRPLFPQDDDKAPQTTLTTSARRLSTRYNLSLVVPPPDKTMMGDPTEGVDEQMQALVKGMLASFELSFSLKAPGRVVATSGTVVGPGRAQWKLGFDDLGKSSLPDFTVTTELPNWTNLGRLADQLAYNGRLYDCAPRLAAALERGLLPNPPLNAAAAQKLAPEDYARLLEIIDKLDAAGRPAITENLIKKLELNRDETSAETIIRAHARVMKLDVRGLSDNAIGDALGQKLR